MGTTVSGSTKEESMTMHQHVEQALITLLPLSDGVLTRVVSSTISSVTLGVPNGVNRATLRWRLTVMALVCAVSKWQLSLLMPFQSRIKLTTNNSEYCFTTICTVLKMN